MVLWDREPGDIGGLQQGLAEKQPEKMSKEEMGPGI